jgi:outer membrane protein insertion porin family
VAFVDFGTVERNTEVKWQDFRISPCLGLRISIPALGPAPIALDFAVPIHHAPGDREEIFSFFVGLAR